MLLPLWLLGLVHILTAFSLSRFFLTLSCYHSPRELSRVHAAVEALLQDLRLTTAPPALRADKGRVLSSGLLDAIGSPFGFCGLSRVRREEKRRLRYV